MGIIIKHQIVQACSYQLVEAWSEKKKHNISKLIFLYLTNVNLSLIG